MYCPQQHPLVETNDVTGKHCELCGTRNQPTLWHCQTCSKSLCNRCARENVRSNALRAQAVRDPLFSMPVVPPRPIVERACPRCTYLNRSASDYCEMCENRL